MLDTAVHHIIEMLLELGRDLTHLPVANIPAIYGANRGHLGGLQRSHRYRLSDEKQLGGLYG